MRQAAITTTTNEDSNVDVQVEQQLQLQQQQQQWTATVNEIYARGPYKRVAFLPQTIAS